MIQAFDSVKKFCLIPLDSIVLNRVEKFLTFALSFINPYEVVEGERKLAKRVIAFLCVQVVGWLSSIAYAVERFHSHDNVDLSEKAELVAMALLLTRCLCYSGSIFVLGSRMEANTQQIIVDRASQRSSTAAWKLALEYSRKEFMASMIFFLYIAIAMVFIIFSPAFMPNQLRLMFNFKILLFPFDNVFSVNWYLSYLFQIIFEVLLTSYYSCFVSITLHLMDHSCWTLDNVMILVEELRASSQDHDRKNQESIKSVQEQLKEIVRTSYSTLKWQREVQNMMKCIFLIDFSLQAFMTGLSLAALANSLKASSTLYSLPMVILPQLFVSCLMGERCARRVEELTEKIYDLPWYLMDAKQRKEILMILIMSQKINGFHGIFYQVNMETFQEILKLTYSFFMLMRSMN